jgi:hypothetical protein
MAVRKMVNVVEDLSLLDLYNLAVAPQLRRLVAIAIAASHSIRRSHMVLRLAVNAASFLDLWQTECLHGMGLCGAWRSASMRNPTCR